MTRLHFYADLDEKAEKQLDWLLRRLSVSGGSEKGAGVAASPPLPVPFVTAKELARRLGIHADGVRQWQKRHGDLVCYCDPRNPRWCRGYTTESAARFLAARRGGEGAGKTATPNVVSQLPSLPLIYADNAIIGAK